MYYYEGYKGVHELYGHLKELRESLGLTQEEFGKSVGVAKTTYNNYEKGERDPKSDFWIAVAGKYGVTIDYLMGYSDDPKKIGKENTPTPSTDDAGVLTQEELSRISAAMDQLNEEGRERVVEYAEDLAAGGRFKKPCAAELGQKEA